MFVARRLRQRQISVQTLDTVHHMKNLLRKLELDLTEPRYVLTVYGIGLKFTDEV